MSDKQKLFPHFKGEPIFDKCSKCGRVDITERFYTIADNPEGENARLICWPKCQMPQGAEISGEEEFFQKATAGGAS